MTAEFPHVFEPLRLRHKTLTSRITFGAHTANMAEGGLPGERHIGYYRERALGGAGMIVVEPIPIHRTGVLTRGNFRHDDDAVIPAFRRLTDACREANPGRRADPPALPRRPARRRRQLVRAELVAVGAALVPRRRRQPCDDRRRDRGADRRLRRGGRPGAGERVRRRRGLRRLPRGRRPVLGAVVEPADRRVGRLGREPDALLGGDPAPHPRALRGRLHHRARGQRGSRVGGVPLDRRAGRGRRLARRAAADGLRHVRDGLVLRLRRDHPDLALRPADSASRSPPRSRRSSGTRSSRPRATSGRPAAAEAVLAAGHADMVSIVRGQIADPHLVAKARAGRADDVRPCISCNQLCWGRRSRDYWISCLVNPSAGREWAWGGDRFEPSARAASRAGRRRRSGRPGGGPRRGRARPPRDAPGARPDLGGQFRLAGLQPSRGQITDLLDWYARSLEALGVEVRLGVDAGPTRWPRPAPTR